MAIAVTPIAMSISMAIADPGDRVASMTIPSVAWLSISIALVVAAITTLGVAGSAVTGVPIAVTPIPMSMTIADRPMTIADRPMTIADRPVAVAWVSLCFSGDLGHKCRNSLERNIAVEYKGFDFLDQNMTFWVSYNSFESKHLRKKLSCLFVDVNPL